MNSLRWEEKLGDFKSALDRLEEGLKEKDINPLMIDGVIQRFEFNYELAWKVMKYFLEYQGIEGAKSPRSTFREAYAIGLIEDGEAWIDMLKDRNLTSHTYDEERARSIYEKVKEKHFDNLKAVYDRLKEEEVE
ncbi:nucleotidyltransferase substrate binding protein [Halonatronum saccharophilum]|uniref:nucleotidyltransferase substrate binding protein n=1 Tax=Halonatronum saccharophilum TaxID=150060 RepID=UPI0004866401|nr:nucleotidyltransferase substrate binding protein [Halonatronum saccharophilum]